MEGEASRWARQRHEEAHVGRGVRRGFSRDMDTKLGAARTRESIMGTVEMHVKDHSDGAGRWAKCMPRPGSTNHLSVGLVSIVSLQEHMVYNKSMKKTHSEFAPMSHSESLSQQSSAMEVGSDSDEQPEKACCFSWVRCCFKKLCRRLRKRKRSQHLAVSLPHGETGAEEHDGASPPPLTDHSEMEEEEKCSDANDNVHDQSPVTDSVEPSLKPLAQDENTSTTTPPFTGFTSPIIVGVVWKKNFACSGEQDQSINKELEKNKPLNNTMKTNHNEQNEAVHEEQKNNNLNHLNDELKAECATVSQNESKQTGKIQGNHSTEDKYITCKEQTHKNAKRSRCHRKKKNKKRSQNNEEKETNMMEEEEAKTALLVRMVEQERDEEHICEEEKVTMMEEEEMETGNEQMLEERDEEKHHVVEEVKVSDGHSSLKEQTHKMKRKPSTEEKPATHEEQTHKAKTSRRRRRKKNKMFQNNVNHCNNQSSCTIKESSCAEVPPVPEEVQTIVNVTLPTITGKGPVTGVEREGAEHHKDEEESETLVENKEAVPVVQEVMVEQQEEEVWVVEEHEVLTTKPKQAGNQVILTADHSDDEGETNMMEEKEARTILLDSTLEQKGEQEQHTGEEEKVTMMEKEEGMEKENEQKQGQKDEDNQDIDEEGKVTTAEVSDAECTIQEEPRENESLESQHNFQEETVEAKNNNSDSCFPAGDTLEGESAVEQHHKAAITEVDEHIEEDVNRSPVAVVDHHLTQEPNHHTAAITQPAASYLPPPWQYPPPSYNGSLQALRQEVLDFHRWAGGTEAESRRRMRPVEDVRGAVGALWPAAQVQVTGSLANGLYLPDSDVDLTLQTGVEVDVSLGGEAAVRAAVLVADFKKQFNTLTPVVLFVRYYLKQLNLGQVFTGGVSSYAVTLMATSLLQLQVPPEEREDPGLVLLRFFYFYGHQFSYATTGISVLGGGRYLRKEDVPTVMPGGHRRADLCIQDPLTPGNDLGRSSFRVWEARRAFQHAYLVLAPAANAPGRYTSPCSLLGQLLLGYGPPLRCLPDGLLHYNRQCVYQQQVPRLPQQERHHKYEQSSQLAAQEENHLVSRLILQRNNQYPSHRGSKSNHYSHQQGYGEVYRHSPQQQRHHTIHQGYYYHSSIEWCNQRHDETRHHHGQQDYWKQYYQSPADGIQHRDQQGYRAWSNVKQNQKSKQGGLRGRHGQVSAMG
ncbi:hypothetical protein O3P69_001940 [Scylla paramamosain]|uniref:PAP-associated domain-containing protein 5 n=1 Tax=Scylla paramamosain TaxID=85552 RepID=A0AAW0V3C8_SCYPA